MTRVSSSLLPALVLCSCLSVQSCQLRVYTAEWVELSLNGHTLRRSLPSLIGFLSFWVLAHKELTVLLMFFFDAHLYKQ